MADEVTAVPSETPEIVEGATVDATGQNGEAPKTFTQADLDRILSERLAQAQRTAEAKAKKAATEAEQRTLAEQGEWRKLAEVAQAELAEAKKQAAEAQAALLRREVATKHNLPSALVDRLRGETLEELDEDAKALMAALPKPSAPNINGAAGNGRVPGTGAMSDEEIRELANVLNVNPKYLKP